MLKDTKAILFCPKTLAKTLQKFSKVKNVSLNSHKCFFKENHETGLWEMTIRENTYSTLLNRTYKNTYKMITGGTIQSVEMLINNLGAFHLAIEILIRDKTLSYQEQMDSILNLRTIYADRKSLMDYLDIVIIPLIASANQNT